MDDVDFDIEFAEANENDDVVIYDEQNEKNLDLTEPVFDIIAIKRAINQQHAALVELKFRVQIMEQPEWKIT